MPKKKKEEWKPEGVSVKLTFDTEGFFRICLRAKELRERYVELPLKQIALLENISLVYEYIDPLEFGMGVNMLWGFADELEPDFVIIDPTMEDDEEERRLFFMGMARIHLHREGIELKGSYTSGSTTLTFEEMKKKLRDGSL